MTDLTCREVIEFLGDYRSGDLPAGTRAAFDAHLTNCRHCRDYLRTYEDAIKLGRGALLVDNEPRPREVPEALVNAIINAIRTPPA